MNLRNTLSALLVLVAVAVAAQARPQARSIQFAVRHQHRWGSCDGILRVDRTGITYETPAKQHTKTWPFRDIRHADFRSMNELELETYGEPETWKFELRDGEWSAALFELLAENIERNVTSRLLFPTPSALYEISVRHRHRKGGCEGMLRIGSDKIVYDADHPEDRRIWRIRDLRSFGRSGPYSLRLTTEAETFNFDLKQPLTQEIYDHLWNRIYERPRNAER